MSVDGISFRTTGRFVVPVVRAFALGVVSIALCFVLNAVLVFWLGWPGVGPTLGSLGVAGFKAPLPTHSVFTLILGVGQISSYALCIVGSIAFAVLSPHRTLERDSAMLSAWVGFIIRWAFWAVLLVGAVDAVISFLRVEGLLVGLVGENLDGELGRPNFRGHFVHYPLIALAGLIAARSKSLGFPWLAMLIVIAEVLIVIARFVFSYEQAFMSDLVRFWYAGLFLFASPYTLVTNGHVRVDVLYAGFSAKAKAWTNAFGSLFLGLPLCWIIIALGMWGPRNVITSPLLNFEVTQSGYGMYVKYLLAGYLLVFALAMLIQFAATITASTATLLGGKPDETADHAQVAPA